MPQPDAHVNPLAAPPAEIRLAASLVRGATETQQAASLPISPASAEFDLLRLCTAVELDAARVSQIANCVRDGINWNLFLRLADHHGVLSLIAMNVLSHAGGLPEQITHSLQSAYEANLRRNLWFAGELARIAGHLENKKLPALPYKGPILAEYVYGDLALRNFCDLDFLVSPADLRHATQALGELGYHPSAPLKPEIEPLWLRFGYERAFDSAAGKFLVELQWNLLPHFYAVGLETEELLERSVAASIGAQEIRTLSPEDLLLVLSLHAAKHLWTRLIWIADIAETIRTQSINYELVLSRARSLGILRILGVSFWLAENVLTGKPPEPARSILVADPEVQLLGESFAARLRRAATYDFESSDYFRLIMRLRERRVDRWRYLWRLVWTPGQGDLEAVDLPESFFSLYRVVRVARLMRKFSGKPEPRSPDHPMAR